MPTTIEWTNETWNPVRGCSKVSEGCRNCYAMSVAARFSGPGQPYEGLARRSPARWTGKVQLVEERLRDPLRWQRPKLVFVNSMSDLFHEDIPDEWIDRIFAVMAQAQRHTFQVLTKRPERMRSYCTARMVGLPLPNVWLGVSAEDQQTFDERVEILGRTPAAIRFVSAEPLLGPIDVGNAFDGPAGEYFPVDWIIAGGESGPNARPCDLDWPRSLRDQCAAAEVPFFLKQMGTVWAHGHGGGKGGDMDYWPADLRIREMPGSVNAAR